MTKSWDTRLEKKLHGLEHKLKPLRNLKETTNLNFALYFSSRSTALQIAKYYNSSSFAYLEITATKINLKITIRCINCKVLMLRQVVQNTPMDLLCSHALSF